VDPDSQQKLADLATRREKERKRFYARRPKRAGDIVASVIAKRRYAAAKAAGELGDAWRRAAAAVLGDERLAGMTRVAGLSRGRLDVTVANHVVMQEINFHRPALLEAVQRELPDARIGAVRFRSGRID